MNIAVVKFNAGNVESVRNSLLRLGVEPVVSDDAEILKQADKVIFPGVGEASTAMRYLRERNLDKVIKSLVQPVLGICLGMQLMCEFSEENDTDCLGLLPFQVKRFHSGELKVPHVGWNTISGANTILLDGVAENAYQYFVHGYYVETGEQTAAYCDYGVKFSAAIECDNFHAVQFHPEKSGAVGEKILENFLRI